MFYMQFVIIQLYIVCSFTAKLTLTGAELKISGADLSEDYVFDQLHFHWGHDDTVGSEHEIDGHDYPLEVKHIKMYCI